MGSRDADLAPEADAIARVLGAQHPGFRAYLPTVLIEALNKYPIDPKQIYPSYRLIRRY